MSQRLAAPLLIGLGVLLGGTGASAQIPVVQADRPGVATPPIVIPVGHIQIETGVQLERQTDDDDDPDTDTVKVPDLLVRVGIHERVELRVLADGLLYEFRDGETDRALASDFSLGTKISLYRPEEDIVEPWPRTSVELQLSFPVGSRAATSDGFDPKLAGLIGWKLSDQAGLVLNTNFSAPTQGSNDSRRIFQFDPSASLEYQITPTIGSFFEYFGEVKTGGEADEHSLDGGFTWMIIEDRVQLDISGGGGLNDAAPDWFVSAGISMRFDAPWLR